MSEVRVLVGTRKGAFVLTSNKRREQWDISGPYFGGWEIYHVAGSPVNPDRIYASQTSDWFGQIIQRSDDGGKTWMQAGTPGPNHEHLSYMVGKWDAHTKTTMSPDAEPMESTAECENKWVLGKRYVQTR